jgi:uncharacterized protein YbaP (TraB family)
MRLSIIGRSTASLSGFHLEGRRLVGPSPARGHSPSRLGYSCRSFWKRFLPVVLVTLLGETISQALAQAPSPATTRSCLWKVTSRDSTVHMLGSVHLLKKDAYPLNRTIESAFNGSQTLLLEVNLDEMTSHEVQQLILSKGLLADGKTLPEVLSKESLVLVKERIDALGLQLEAVQRLKPWLLTMTLALAKLQQLGYDPAHGIDKYFFDKAKGQRKEILALETAEFQINLLDSLPPKTQEAALLQTLKELDMMEKEFDAIVQAWKIGDTKRLEDSLLESFKEYPEVYQKIVSERNKNWIPKIEELLERRGNTLLVVGAAHLVGPHGVVELLRNKGYVVEPQ